MYYKFAVIKTIGLTHPRYQYFAIQRVHWDVYLTKSYSPKKDTLLHHENETSQASKKIPLSHFYRSCLHGIETAFAFFMMLVSMTFNGWIMISMVLGSTVGFYFV